MEGQVWNWVGLLLSLLLAFVLSTSPTEGRVCHVCDPDVTIIVDTSGSVHFNFFKHYVKPTLGRLTETMYSTISRHRTAMISYDHRVKFVLRFTYEQNLVRAAVKGFHYGGGATATGDALKAAAINIKKCGRLYKPQLVILFTDGYTNIGCSVATAIKFLHAVADRVIVVGITKYVKMHELNMIAKNSGVIWFSDKNKLRLAIPRIMHKLCRVVRKVCPKPQHLRARCVGNQLEYRTIVYYPWNGECVKKTRIRHVTVKCRYKLKPYYFCSKCIRYWVLKYTLIHHCKCIMKTHIFHAGRCCCPKASRSIRRTRMFKTIVLTSYSLINGKCWRRRVCQVIRCGCPHAHHKVWCVMNRHVVQWHTRYIFVKKRYCRKVVVKRVSPVVCRQVQIIAMSKHCFQLNGDDDYSEEDYGDGRYLKITLAYQVRDGCKCIRELKNVLVPCRCLRKKRWVWIRRCHPSCRRRCRKRKCYKVRVFLTYKLKKYRHKGEWRFRCVPKVLLKHRYKCCCHKRRLRKKRKCKHGRWVTSVCFYKLFRGTCHKICRWTSFKVNCRHGVIKRQIKRLKDGRYKVIDWVLCKKDCRCRTKKKIKYIPWRCKKRGGLRKKCTAGILYVRAKYYLLVGFRCKIRIILVRIKVDCPHYTIFIRRRCNPRTKHFVLLYKKASQTGCKCITVYFMRKGRPCYCRKKKVSKWRCEGNKRYKRVICYYKIFKGRCIRQVRVETKKNTTCNRKVWYSYRCIWRTGVRLVYRHCCRLVRCKCFSSRKLVKKGRCNCHAVNKKHAHIRRIYCDKSKNQLVIMRWIYIYNPHKHCCVRKVNLTRKTVICSKRTTNQRSRCNIHTWTRTLTRAFYRPINCRCRRETAKSRVPCRCNPRSSATVCHKKTGVEETTTNFERFDIKTDRCIKVIQVIRRPTQCRRSVTILRSRCVNGTYMESTLRAFRKPGTCECSEQMTRVKRPCACPPKRRMTACHGYFKRIIITIYTWNSVTMECVRSHEVSYKLRCRCPRSQRTVQCIKGQRITTITTYTLRFYACIRRVRITRCPVECSKRLRQRKGKCRRCKYTLFTLAHIPLPRRCRCRWRVIFRRRCRCCPCPRTTVQIDCVGFAWKVTRISWLPVFIGSCKITCIPIVKIYFRPIVFPPQPQSHWTECKDCKQNFVYYTPVIKKCKGSYRKIVTPQTRQCCCLKNPETNVKCVNGKFVTTTITYALKNFQCVQQRILETRSQPCPDIPSIFIRGDCNSDTCLRQVYTEQFLRDSKSCVCKRRRAALFRERCCCPNKGYKRRVCLGHCKLVMTLVVTFDRSTKQCVERKTSSRTCIRCRGPKIYRGSCRPKSCHRFIYTKTWRSVDCTCRYTVTRRPERCCCRAPTRFRKSCEGNIIVRTRERFRRVDDKCVPITETTRFLVPCRVGILVSTRAGNCNPLSCKRLVVRTFEKRSGCTCVRFSRETSETCCCPPKRSKLVCEKNKNIVKVTVFYVLVNKKCMRKVERKTKRKIPRCRCILTSTKCNRKTKRRTLIYTFYKVKNCRCVKSRIKRRSYPCICRKPYKFYRRCRRRSCRQRFIRIWFVLVKGKYCRRRRKVGHRVCCCKKKRWSYKRCNRRTGQVEVLDFRPIFSRKFHRCFIFSTIRSLGIATKCFHVKPKIRRGPCDEKTGLARDFLIYYSLKYHLCRCIRRLKPRIRICSCKHLPCKTTRSCRNGFTVKVTTCWVLLAGSCHPIRNIIRRPVICRRNRVCVRKCNQKTCKAEVRCSERNLVNCDCKTSVQVRNLLCCCAKPTRKVTCESPFRVVTLTGYILNSAQDKCRRFVTRKRTAVRSCARRKRRVRGKCNKRTGIRIICILIYSIRKCRCVVVKKRRRAERCRCPRGSTRASCNRITGVKTRFLKYYRLVDGLCLQHQHIFQKETRCDSVSIRVLHCDSKTRKRNVYITTFRRKHCKCRRSVKRIIQTCRCGPPRITRSPCKPGQKMRAVTYVYYELRNIAGAQICARTTRTFFYEPCVCAAEVRKFSCESNAPVTTIITQKMVKRFGQRVCISVVRRMSRIIKCTVKITRGRCINTVRTITTDLWRLFNCQCVRFRRTRKEACNCHTRNSKRRFCKMGVKFVVSLIWTTKPGFRDCHLTRIVAATSVRCSKRKVIPLTRSCPIRKGYGRYRKYLIVWYVIRNCRCRKRKRFILRLCRCKRSCVLKRCAGTKIIVKRFSFFSKFNWCFRRVRTTHTPIRCLLPRASLRATPCRRVKPLGRCERLVTVTERRVRECVCRSFYRRFTQVCCPPKDKTRTYCDHQTGYRITERTVYFLTTAGVFYNEDDVFVGRRAVKSQKIVTRRRIVCPPSSRRVGCDLRSKVKTVVWTIIQRVGCRCTEKKKITKGKCKCPPSKKKRYRCIHYTQRVDTIYYVLVNNVCKPRKIIRRERCDCPKNRSWRFCDRKTGARVSCTMIFVLNQRRRPYFCQKRKHCHSRRLKCGAKRVIRGKCNKKTGKRIVYAICYIRNRHRCRCVKRIKKKYEICSCDHLNSKIKRCNNGFIERVTKIFLLSNGCCSLKLRRTLREIVCPKTVTFIRNDCAKTGPRAGHKTKFTRFFVLNRASCVCEPRTRRVLIPCICKLTPGCKTKITRRCVRNVVVVRTDYCVLVGEVCEKRWKEVRSTIRAGACKKKIGKCKKSKHGGYCATVYIYKTIVKNCHPVEILIGTRKRICKCPPKRVKKKCISHCQILVMVTRFFRHKSRTHCLSVVVRMPISVHCPRSKLRVYKCNPRTCLRRVTRIFYRAIRCKCQRFKKHFTRFCCCRRLKRHKIICAADGRTLIARWVTFKLAYGKCYPIFHAISKRLECETQQPIVRTDRVCRRNFRRRRITTFVTKRCKCIPKTRITHLRCNCPPRELLVRHKCVGQWAIDLVFVLRFNSKTQLCNWRLARKSKRLCRCPPDTKETRCVRQDTIEEIVTGYDIMTRSNTCKKTVSRSRLPIGRCCRKPLLVRVIYGPCLKKNGFIQTDQYYYSIAKNCKCDIIRRIKRWPCNCWESGGQTRKVVCRNNNVKVMTVAGLENKGKKCTTRIFVRRITIACVRIRVRRSVCGPDGLITITTMRQFVRACQCHWRLFRITKVPCRCPKETSSIRCVGQSAWRTERVSHKLANDICHKTVVISNRPVACRVGVFVTRSACSSSGNMVITRTTNRLHNCRCLRTRATRSCRCRCPKPYHHLKCLRRKHMWCEMNVVFTLKNCVCIANKTKRTWSLPCVSSRTTRTTCRLQRGGDGYRWYRKIVARRYKCKCRRRLQRWKRLCSCAPRIKRVIRCHKPGTRITIYTQRVLSFGKCQRKFVRRVRETVVCGRPQKKTECNNGIETTVTKTPYVINCHCGIRVSVEHARCHCDRRERLVRTTPCIKCTKKFIYTRLVFVNRACVPKERTVSEMCCCPRKETKTRRCNRRNGVITEHTTQLVLRNGRCVPETTTRQITVVCLTFVSIQIIHLPSGIIISVQVYYVLIVLRCRCVQKKKSTKIGYWKCPHPVVHTRCLNHHTWERKLICYKLVKKTCVRNVKTRLIPVLCKFAVSKYTPCRSVPYGCARSIVRRWYRRRRCKCIPRIRYTRIICRCWRPRVRRVCNRKTGVLSICHERFVPARSRRRCRKISRVVHRTIRCAPRWVQVERLPCFILRRRSVRRGCRCRTEIQRIPVKIRCRKDAVIRGRCNERICRRRIKHITHQPRRCHCVRRVFYHMELCYDRKCPRPRIVKRRCIGGLKVGLIIYYKRIRCRCRRFTRVFRRRPKCYYVHKYAIGPCKKGYQLFAVVRYIHRRCRCIPVKRTYKRFCSCRLRPTELIFVIASGHSGYRSFKTSIARYLKAVISSEPISRRYVRVAIVRSCQRPLLLFNLNRSHPKLSLTVMRFLRRISLCCRHIHLGAALRTVRNRVLPTARQRTAKLVVIVSQGRAHIMDSHLARQEAKKLKSRGVKIKAIGINPGLKKSLLLKRLVSKPGHRHYSGTSSASHLLYFMDFVHACVCPPIFY